MFVRELLHAARSLPRTPAFALTSAISIALGIGAATAIFSVADAMLLRPLPYRSPDRLVFVMPELRARNVKDYLFSNADFIDVRDGAGAVFEELGAIMSGRSAVPQRDGSLEEIRFAMVTPNFFRLMGASVAVGRDFVDADGQAPAAAQGGASAPPPAAPLPVILSYEYWQRRFGGDRSILGRPAPGTTPGGSQIVGVLAPGFELLFRPEANIERVPDTWFPTRLVYDAATRNGVSLRAVARLRNGVTLDAAQTAMETASAGLRTKSNVWQTADFHIALERMQAHLSVDAQPALVVIAGAALFLLLTACANVANLLLVRISVRERDLAVRRALGGNTWRLLSPTLAEGLLLAVAGATGGVGLAWAGIRQLRLMAPPNLPRVDTIAFDTSALLFAAIATLATAAVVSLAPLWGISRPDLARVLRASGRTGASRHANHTGLLRHAVVVAAVTLSFVLLTGSGLMVRSFFALQRINLQFEPHGLLTFHLVGSRGGALPRQRAAFMRDIEERLRALPGVQQVAASTPLPLAGGFNATRWGTEEALTDQRRLQSADFQTVLPGYFETLRTPLLAGRTFTESDNRPQGPAGTPDSAAPVVVVDEDLVRKAFPGGSAIGKRLVIRPNLLAEVVGVVAHQRATSLTEPGREQIYFTDGFMGHGVVSYWAIRTAGTPASLAPAVRNEMAKLGSRVLVTELQPMDALVERAQGKTRVSLLLIGVFAVVAALLAGVGLYGVLSTLVRQRTAEIGVRMALGAAPASIFTLVVGQGLRLSAAGIVLGLVASAGLTRAMASLLVGVTPTDPATFTVMAVLFFAIAAIASWLPAQRAASVDPIEALREE